MKYSVHKNVFILFIVFYATIIGHGFGPQTLVYLSNNSQETIHSICLHTLYNKISVTSYNITHSRSINRAVTMGKQSTTNCYIRLGFDSQRNNDIICTPTQEFYVPTLHEWIPAYKLKPGDALLTKNMTTTPVKYKEFIPKPLKIYMLEIEDSHTFFVGKYAILTHNILLPAAAYLGFTVPFGSVAAGTAGSFLGPIGLIGGVVIGGIASIAIKAIYENRIHGYKTPEYNIVFIQNYCHNIPQNAPVHSGCFNPDASEKSTYVHVIPLEHPSPQISTGCIEIEISNQENQIAHCYDISDEHQKINPQGCFEPVEQNEKVLFNKQEKTTASENTKIRYQGEKARNWDEFEKNCHIGQKYGKKFVHTGIYNKDGSPVRKLVEDIPHTEMFKKNRFFALDKFHEGDHFEVWDKNKKWIGVANLDGSENDKKTNAVQDKHRRKLSK